MDDTIKVLIVDDSPLIRQILTDMLESEPEFKVAGRAQDGREAVQMADHLRPDVITMDIRMPRLDGLEATRQIMSACPTPIIVVASSIYESDMNIAFNAIAAGALTVVEKPKGLAPTDYDAVRDQLLANVRLMRNIPLVTLGATEERQQISTSNSREQPEVDVKLISIAASTGGPGALNQILKKLPEDFSIPIVVVQHMSNGFTKGFAQWLDKITPLDVRIATDGEQIMPGSVLIAPEDTHVKVGPDSIIRLEQSPPVNKMRPSANYLFDSAAQAYGMAAVGIVLTGIGDDGIEGLSSLRQVGGYVVAQDEESSAVFETPKEAIDLDIVDQILSPKDIASLILSLNGQRSESVIISAGR